MRGETGGILEQAIKETAEMATELLSLRAQLAELRGQEPAGFRWRHRADEHSGASAWIYLPCDRADEFIKRIADKDNTVEYEYVFSRPVPPAASDLTLAGWQACRDGNWFSIKAEDVPHYRDNEGVPVREVYAISIF